MYVKLVAQKTPEPDTFKVFTIRPDQDWGTYSLQYSELVCTGKPSYGPESFDRSLVDEWRYQGSEYAPTCEVCHGNGTTCSCGDSSHVPCQGNHFVIPCGNCQSIQATKS